MTGQQADMAAKDPQGGQKYWFDGLPYEGIKTSNQTGSQKYWFDGLPAEYLFPAGSVTRPFPMFRPDTE